MKKILAISLFAFISCNKEFSTEVPATSIENTKTGIKNILISNGIKEENISFDERITKDNSLVFSSKEELEIFLKKIEAEKKLLLGKELKITPERQLSEYSLPRSYWGYEHVKEFYAFHLKGFVPSSFYTFLNLDGNIEIMGTRENTSGVGNMFEPKISSFYYDTYMTGVMLGISYIQTSSGTRELSGGMGGRFDLHIREGRGVVNYNILVENIGTVFTEELRFDANIILNRYAPGRVNDGYLFIYF